MHMRSVVKSTLWYSLRTRPIFDGFSIGFYSIYDAFSNRRHINLLPEIRSNQKLHLTEYIQRRSILFELLDIE